MPYKAYILSIQSLCLLRLSTIGDVCHAVAMVHRIQQTRPDIQITWIIGKLEYQLLRDMPGIRFVVFDKKQGKAAYRHLKAALGNQCFDALFVMQVALRANWASRLVKARLKIGFDWQRSKELHWLFANQRIKAQTHAHVLEGFMGFADAIGIPKLDKPSWNIPLSDADNQWAQQQHENTGQFAVISPAASKAERNWLSERYANVADYIQQQGIAVVFCGGPTHTERHLIDDIFKHCKHLHTNLIGQTSLKQLLALLQRAQFVIAPDTGPAHMATAVGTPVIGLYAHSNPRRTGPYLSLERVVSVYDRNIQQQHNRPWQQLPWGLRAKGKNLMAQISEEAVQQQVDLLL